MVGYVKQQVNCEGDRGELRLQEGTGFHLRHAFKKGRESQFNNFVANAVKWCEKGFLNQDPERVLGKDHFTFLEVGSIIRSSLFTVYVCLRAACLPAFSSPFYTILSIKVSALEFDLSENGLLY